MKNKSYKKNTRKVKRNKRNKNKRTINKKHRIGNRQIIYRGGVWPNLPSFLSTKPKPDHIEEKINDFVKTLNQEIDNLLDVNNKRITELEDYNNDINKNENLNDTEKKTLHEKNEILLEKLKSLKSDNNSINIIKNIVTDKYSKINVNTNLFINSVNTKIINSNIALYIPCPTKYMKGDLMSTKETIDGNEYISIYSIINGKSDESIKKIEIDSDLSDLVLNSKFKEQEIFNEIFKIIN